MLKRILAVSVCLVLLGQPVLALAQTGVTTNEESPAGAKKKNHAKKNVKKTKHKKGKKENKENKEQAGNK